MIYANYYYKYDKIKRISMMSAAGRALVYNKVANATSING